MSQPDTEFDAVMTEARMSIKIFCNREYNRGVQDGRASVSDRYDEGHAAGYRQGYAVGLAAAETKAGAADLTAKRFEYLSKHFDKIEQLQAGGVAYVFPCPEFEQDPELFTVAARKIMMKRPGGARGDGTVAFAFGILRFDGGVSITVRRRRPAKADATPSQQQQQPAAAPAAAAAAPTAR